MQNIDMCLRYKSHQIARLVSHLINYFRQWMFTEYEEYSTKFGTHIEILHIFYIIKWLFMVASCSWNNSLI